MNRKITLPELVSLVAESTNTTKRMSELFLRELLATVSQALIEGDNVTIKNLGTFKVVKSTDKQASTNRRNKPTSNIIFVPDKKLAEAINQPFEAFVPMELSDDLSEEQLEQIDNELAAEELIGNETEVEHEVETEEQEPPKEIETDVKSPQPSIDIMSETQADNVEPAATITSETPVVTPLISDTQQDTQDPVTTSEVFASETVENKKPSSKSFLWGLITGVVAALIVALICWGLWGRSTTSNITAVQPDTIADTSNVDRPIAQKIDINQVTDTCTRWLQLKSMAKKHYGRHAFWVYIYEENKSIIDNPRRVEPGTILVIPPAEKYGINAKSRESLQKAQKKGEELDSLFMTKKHR